MPALTARTNWQNSFAGSQTRRNLRGRGASCWSARLMSQEQTFVSLRGQVRYRFYEIDREDKKEILFFSRGEPGPGGYEKSAYSKRVAELARHLWEKAQEFSQQGTVPSPPEPRRSVTHSGRTVFVAQPAGDMKGPYLVLLEELTGRGHRVVPDPERELPIQGSNAVAYMKPHSPRLSCPSISWGSAPDSLRKARLRSCHSSWSVQAHTLGN